MEWWQADLAEAHGLREPQIPRKRRTRPPRSAAYWQMVKAKRWHVSARRQMNGGEQFTASIHIAV